MKKLLIFTFILFVGLGFVSGQDTSVDKGAGIMYFTGEPGVTPNITYHSEIAINVLTEEIWKWNRDSSAWKLHTGIISAHEPPSGDPGTGARIHIDKEEGSIDWWDGNNWTSFHNAIKDTIAAPTGTALFSIMIDTVGIIDSIYINNNGTWVLFDTGGGSGETNTASNVGSGDGVFKQKTGVDFEFRSISPGAGMTSVIDGDSIVVAADGSNITGGTAITNNPTGTINVNISELTNIQGVSADTFMIIDATDGNLKKASADKFHCHAEVEFSDFQYGLGTFAVTLPAGDTLHYKIDYGGSIYFSDSLTNALMIRRGGVFDLDSMEMALEQAFHQAQPGAIAIVDTTLNTPYSFMVRGIPRSPIDTAQLIIIDENGSFASAQMRFDGVGNIGDFRFRVTTSSTFSNVSITTNVSDGLTAGFSVQTAGTSTYYIPQAIMDSVEHAIFRVSVAAASSSGCQTQLWEFNFADKPTVSNDSENVISASLVDGGAYLDGFTDGGEAGGADRTLGNTDNFDLGLKVNNVIAMYLQNDGNVGFGTITPDKTIGISDGTDEFGISVDAGEWKLWNDAGTPVSKLSVDSTGRAALNAAIVSNIQFGIKSSSTNTFIQRWTSSDNHQLANFLEDGATGGRWDIYNSANAVKIRFYPGGNNSYFTDTQVGFGTTTPDSATVQIATGIDTYDLYIGQTTPYSKVTAGSGWVTSSDTTKKKNLVPVETLISKNQIAQKILNTGVYRFQWKEESLYVPFDSTNVSMWDSLTVSEKLFQKEGYMIKEWKRAQRAAKKKNFGFAAQEYGANFEGDPNTKEINWQKITVIQWYAIQQLIKQNQQQNQKLNDLEARILALEKMH